MPRRSTDLYICDIYESIRIIVEDAVNLSFNDFKNIKNKRDAIFFRLMIIGEAVNHLPKLKSQFEINFHEILRKYEYMK